MTDAGDPTAETAMLILREHGPLDSEGWAKLMVAQRLGSAEDMLELAENIDHPILGLLADGRNIAVDSFLEGKVFTHRLTSAEIAAGIIFVDGDLNPLIYLADGEELPSLVIPAYDDDILDERGLAESDRQFDLGLLISPTDIGRFVDGDVVAVIARGGDLYFERVGTKKLPIPDLRPALVTLLGDDRSEQIEHVIWQLMSDDVTLFDEPTAPLSELIAAAGYTIENEKIAVAGFDFKTARLQHFDDFIASTYEMEPAEASAVSAFGRLVTAYGSDDKPSEADVPIDPLVFAPLHDSYVAEIARKVSETAIGFVPGDFAAASEALIRRGGKKVAATARWFAGRAADREGRVLDAEKYYEDALSWNKNFEPALLDLANIASVRGDAPRAISFLNRLGDGSASSQYSMLQNFLPVARPGLSRNAPCWCGSGRKYKQCHLNKVETSLDDRAKWLYNKAGSFVDDSDTWGALIQDLADERAEYWPDHPDPIGRALADGLVVDVVLFEEGGFDDFIERRGELLPADELLLAQQWQLIERSLHEVESVRPGEGFTLRDVRTGDRNDVTERVASKQLKVGEFICARVVPAGSVKQIFGGIEPIALSQREALLELLDSDDLDPADLVDFLSARYAPPSLVTSDGETMVACEASFAIDDAATLRRSLDNRYGPSTDDHWRWLVGESVHGTIRIVDGELVLDAMNERRFDELLKTVGTFKGCGDLIEQQRISAADRLAELLESPVPSEPLDPDLVPVLDDFVRDYEVEWLDQPIPALDGATPREAAADPTRRDDLTRLLDSFPRGQGTMSVERLRVMLNL
ncbi:SEC-C domain-containing protein [Antrihabitans sp. YC3-6]|uniref:SEC-C domain-containing protein n=1 Tax=Antrihabitans stalagmiti TaxID=2799499 RepID=A0A934NTP7_9NOCA|nr:SEC-C domain-containing protein [Antrihabitans stalagmiti]MBJ8341047.1 SEC-C domain-containing protein [Antrihabitans stalagmiti]